MNWERERCQNVVRWPQWECPFVITWLFLSENPTRVQCIQLHSMVGAVPGLSQNAAWSGVVGNAGVRKARQAAAGMTSPSVHWALPLCQAHTQHVACKSDNVDWALSSRYSEAGVVPKSLEETEGMRQDIPPVQPNTAKVTKRELDWETVAGQRTGGRHDQMQDGTPDWILEQEEDVNGKTGEIQVWNWVNSHVPETCQFLSLNKCSRAGVLGHRN